MVTEFGGKVVMTDPKWENGTERCLEVLRKLESEGQSFDIVVNIQGDEPLIEKVRPRSALLSGSSSPDK